ncbi:MAG: DJ-1/PfpI family protein [Cephaloticoccus sp.]|nr:DJ-1/PfpI family protein [Cephaloticoccus sp.]MCF7759714.1 DJ-1/PfpI family protein [Cephaloticoccus sp.]
MSNRPSKHQPQRGVIITAEAFEDEEVMYPIMRLREADMIIDIATKDAKLVNGRMGFPLELMVKYYGALVDATKLDAADYDFVILPGGFEAPDRVRQIPEVLSFVRTMHAQKKIVGAFCHGPWILISAGLTKGIKATGYVGIKDDIINSGAEYLDEAVVIDGNIVTSRHPRDIGVFMKAFLAELAR